MEKEMRWVYEEIVARIPPFSWLPPQYIVLVQLLLLLVLGLLLGFIFKLKEATLIYGTLGIFVEVLWSLLILQLAPTLRKFRAPLSRDENLLLERYKKVLFHRNHFELIPGLLIFAGFMTYLSYLHCCSSVDLLEEWFGPNIHPLLLLFTSLLLWDISYRMGIGVWTTGLALWRSVKLKEIAEKRTELEHTPYTELNYLKKLDINNGFFAIISLLLLPVLWSDPVLVSVIMAFVAVITTTSLISAHMISGVPWLPPDIFNLVKDSDFAYVGTSGEDMSPHLTPVVYVFDGSRIFFNTSKEATKLKYLHKNNKIAFLIDKRDLSNIYDNKAVLFKGEVKIYGIKDLFFRIGRMAQARKLFFEKYPEYTRKYSANRDLLPRAWQLTPVIARILIEVKPVDIIYWRGAKQIRVPV